MPVNPKIQKILTEIHANPIPFDKLSPADFRKRETMQSFEGKKEEVGLIDDRMIKLEGRALPIRIYRPLKSGPEKLPVLVYFHGGGWVTGSIETHDNTCRELANLAACAVVSVDYRLAPEHKFPAAAEDAFDSFRWVHDHAEELNLDKTRIAVGGDSAGGNLATVACLIADEKKAPKPIFQLLLYPSAGYEGEEEPASMKENAEGYLLTREMMQWFRKHYYQKEEDAYHRYASPVLAENLRAMPPAAILTAEYDPLRDSGRAYAEKLEQAGAEVFYKNYPGLIHGFAGFSAYVEEANQAMQDAADALRNAF